MTSEADLDTVTQSYADEYAYDLSQIYSSDGGVEYVPNQHSLAQSMIGADSESESGDDALDKEIASVKKQIEESKKKAENTGVKPAGGGKNAGGGKPIGGDKLAGPDPKAALKETEDKIKKDKKEADA